MVQTRQHSSENGRGHPKLAGPNRLRERYYGIGAPPFEDVYQQVLGLSHAGWVAFQDYSQVEMLVMWYESIDFGGKMAFRYIERSR